MGVKKRISEYCAYKHISVRKFEKDSGLVYGYVAAIRKGIGVEKLDGILNAFPDINREWLLYGKGEMLKSEINSISIEEYRTPERYKKGPYKNTCATENLSVQERLDIFIKSKGLGRYQFEMKVGLPQSYVANVRQAPHPEKVKLISDAFPDLSIEWLITGKGEMIKQDISIYRQLVEVISEEKDRLLSLWQKEQDKVVELEKVNRQLRKDLDDTVKMYGESIHSALDRLLSKRA